MTTHFHLWSLGTASGQSATSSPPLISTTTAYLPPQWRPRPLLCLRHHRLMMWHTTATSFTPVPIYYITLLRKDEHTNSTLSPRLMYYVCTICILILLLVVYTYNLNCSRKYLHEKKE